VGKVTLRGKLTYANVMATLAVFMVLGGGAYAAVRLPKNSVGTRQLKNGAITLAKLKASTKRALKGAMGPQGPTGATGAPGTPGAPGATKVIVRSGFEGAGQAVASCQAGEVATGGGGVATEAESWVWDSTPVQANGEVPRAWEAQAEDTGGNPAGVVAYVICASP
jgi:hypothetical protein